MSRRAALDGRRSERGLALVLSAFSMVALLTITAIVIDIGNARQTRRRAQNAIDAVALAAAAAYDGTTATEEAARTRATTMLSVNTFPGITGTGNTRSCGGGETCTITFSFTSAPRPCVAVAIVDLEVPTYFAGVIGRDRLEVGVGATGCRRSSGAPTMLPGLMATGGTCADPEKAFVTSGNSNRFEGGIHSNFDAKDNGGSNVRTGAATYVDAVVQNNGLWTGATNVTPMTNPLASVTASLYAPGGARSVPYDSATAATDNYFSFSGDQTFSGTIQSGIYYTTGKITINALTIAPHNGHTGATFVTSSGIIDLSGNDFTLRPFDADPNRIVLFSDYDEDGDNCAKESIKMSGNCIRIDGVVYAPQGKLTISGEGNGHDYVDPAPCGGGHTTFSGGFTAWALEWKGNLGVLRGGPSGTATTPEVYLDV